MTTKASAPQVVDFDLPEDSDEELALSHVVRIRKQEFRVLAEPHQWHLLRSSSDPVSIFRAYVHPGDFAALDALLQSQRQMPDGAFAALLTAFMEKPTGHPTKGSPDSSGS